MLIISHVLNLTNGKRDVILNEASVISSVRSWSANFYVKLHDHHNVSGSRSLKKAWSLRESPLGVKHLW